MTFRTPTTPLGLLAFVLAACSGGSSGQHVSAAIQFHNQAASITSKIGPIISTISTQDAKSIIDLDKKALAEAKLADIADMNKRYPGFGDHFRDEFIAGLNLFINGFEVGDGVATLRGQILESQFGDWYQANVDGIRKGH